jgi:hypothetical protein
MFMVLSPYNISHAKFQQFINYRCQTKAKEIFRMRPYCFSSSSQKLHILNIYYGTWFQDPILKGASVATHVTSSRIHH